MCDSRRFDKMAWALRRIPEEYLFRSDVGPFDLISEFTISILAIRLSKVEQLAFFRVSPNRSSWLNSLPLWLASPFNFSPKLHCQTWNLHFPALIVNQNTVIYHTFLKPWKDFFFNAARMFSASDNYNMRISGTGHAFRYGNSFLWVVGEV